LAVVTLLSFATPGKSSDGWIYENNLVVIYEMPATSDDKVMEVAATAIIQKTITDAVGDNLGRLAGKLGGVFLTFLTEMPSVGIATDARLVAVNFDNVKTNLINISPGDELQFMLILTRGDCFNAGAFVLIEERKSPGDWKALRLFDFLEHRELDSLLRDGAVEFGRPFVIVCKRNYRFTSPGKYRAKAEAWRNSEGKARIDIAVE
jgi:hypothetical protein